MAEEALGFAKLLLSADASELKRGIEEAKSHARSMGKTMAEVADEVGGKARRILNLQHEIDRASIQATGTATQRHLFAIDERYGKLIAKAKRAGQETVEIERLRSIEKSRIWEAEAEKARQTLEARAAAEKKTAGVVTEAAGATTKASHGLAAFKDLLKVGGTEARSMAGSLGHLANSGFGAAIAGIAIATKLLVSYIEKLKEGQAANFAFLQGARQERAGLRDMQAEVLALEDGRVETAAEKKKREIQDMMVDLENIDRQIQAEEKLHGPEFLGGKKEKLNEDKASIGNRLDIAKRELELMQKKEALEKKSDTDKVLKDLDKKNRLERETIGITEEQEKLKRGMFEIEERYLGLLKDVNDEEQEKALLTQKQMEVDNLKARLATEAAAKKKKADDEAAEKQKKLNKQRLEDAYNLEIALNDLHHSRLEVAAKAEAATLEDRQALLESEKQGELRDLFQKYAAMEDLAGDNVKELTRLHEEALAIRQQIEEKYARLRINLEKKTTATIAQVQGEAAKVFTEGEARDMAHELYAAGLPQKEIEERLRRGGIDPASIGFGAGATGPAPTRNGGLTPAEEHQRQINLLEREAAWRAASAPLPGTYGPGVDLRAPTSLMLTIQHEVSGPSSRLTEEMLAAAEEDIRRGGRLSQVLEDFFSGERVPR